MWLEFGVDHVAHTRSLVAVLSACTPGCTSLKTLSLRGNRIATLRGLQGLTGLALLDTLHIGGNPICDADDFNAFAAALPYLKD